MRLKLREHPLLETIPSRSFATLMELYESNYILIRRLAPELRAMGDAISVVPDGVDLHLRILERSPYTTSISLTHYFDPESPLRAEPDLRVRVYHDARAAEVMPDTRTEHFRLWAGRRPEPKSLSWRWELNRFLNRWLRYCLAEGHGFPGSGCGAKASTG